MMRRQRLAALAACCVLLAGCAVKPMVGGTGSGGAPAQRTPAPGWHPGEHDPARSAAATAAVAACARAAGWDLENLNVDVSDRGLLIGIRYSAARGGDGVGADETVRRCLDRAGVGWP
jgi:hypothetical protein